MSTATAVGITFVATLIISILLTLLIVYIVYKIRQSTSNNKPSPVSAVISVASLPRGDSTIKATPTSCNDDYEYPENYKSRDDPTTRYQRNPSAPLQPNPAYSMEPFDKIHTYIHMYTYTQHTNQAATVGYNCKSCLCVPVYSTQKSTHVHDAYICTLGEYKKYTLKLIDKGKLCKSRMLQT